MLRRDRQSPRHSHTPRMGVGEGLAQNTETETRHQYDVAIGSAQNKGNYHARHMSLHV